MPRLNISRGIKDITEAIDKSKPSAEQIAAERHRKTMLDELGQSRNRNQILEGRSQEVFQSGRRDLLEDERRRLGSARSATSAAGLAGSGLEQRVLRAERETTAANIEKFRSATSVQELTQAWQGEQAAIQRLWQSGESEMAYYRQVALTQMQIDAAARIARSNMWGNLFGAVGSVATAGLLR